MAVGSEVVRSFCRICAPSCGVLVHIEDGTRVTAVRGDRDHPVSEGYLCPKGRALGDLHHDPRRLDYPLMRRNGKLEPASWEEVLDDLTRRLTRAIDETGPHAIAFYQGTPALKETAAIPVINSLFQQLGSRSRYSSLTVDISAFLTAMTLVLGGTMMPVVDVDETRFLLIVGTNPVVSHGQYNGFSHPVGRLRRIAARGEVWVVDPRRTETARHATHYVPIRPGTDYALLACLARSILKRGPDPTMERYLDGLDQLRDAVEPWDLDRTAAVTGIEGPTISELDAGLARAGRLAVVTGTGLTMAKSANVSQWLTWALLLLTGSFDRPGGMWCNPGFLERRDESPIPPTALNDGRAGPASRPDLPRFLAEHPCAALPDEIEAGNVRTLFSFGGNPLIAVADPDRVHQAARSLDAYVKVGTVRDTQEDVATHVLPAAGRLERADVHLTSATQFKRVAQYTPALVPAVAERRPAWWIFAEIGRRLGLDVMPPGLDLASATDDDLLATLVGGPEALATVKAHDGALVTDGTVTGWALDALPHGRADLAPPLLVQQLAELAASPDPEPGLRLIPRRLPRRFNSVHHLTGRQDEQAVLVNTADAEAAGVVGGQPVRVRSAHGELVGRAVIDDGISRGAVAVSHGFSEVHPGRLLSTSEDIDSLTGMITQTGIPVTISPA